MNAVSYKGHSARVEYDAEDRIFFGTLAGINDVVSFHADNVDDLEHAFREAVDDYLETCKTVGKSPERPYSGKMMFRVEPETHAAAVLAAQLAGKSLNQWAEETLRAAAAARLSASVKAIPSTKRGTGADPNTPKRHARKIA